MTKKNLPWNTIKKGITAHRLQRVRFAGNFGVSEEEMYKIAEGFGLGMGMMDTCGALTGLFMLIGMKNSGGVSRPEKQKQTPIRRQESMLRNLRRSTDLFIVKN